MKTPNNNICPFSESENKCIPYVRMEDAEGANKELLRVVQKLEKLNDELTGKVAQLEEEQPKWISVEDRLPDAGEKVMICGVKNGMQVGAFRGLSNHEKNRMWWWKKNTILEVTHWMPLPSMPDLPEEDA